MKIPEISIVMSAYNDSTFIGQAIESIIHQEFENWELIIIDDASTDNTPSIIKKYVNLDKRIIFQKNIENQGVPISLNIGIKMSKGDYIARIDSDDIWLDNTKLEKQLLFMNRNKDYGLVGTWIKVIDYKNNDLYDLCYPVDDKSIKDAMLKHNCFISSSVLIRKKLVNKVGSYDVISRYAEDYGLWLKLGTVGKLYNIPEYMTGYRINPKGISQNKSDYQINTSIRVIKTYKNYYPNYMQAIILWNMRKFYPKWLKGSTSIKIKKAVSNLMH